MDTRTHRTRMEMKGNSKQKGSKEEWVAVEEDPDEDLELGFGEDEKKRKTKAVLRGSSSSIGDGGGGVSSPPCCQAEKCMVDLSESRRYHRRHKVCEFHSKSAVVIVAGLRQRFCQQCSRFHEVSEFDDTKRSCRRRLAGHNERRRKSSSESHGEGSDHSQGVNSQLQDNDCRQVM